MFSPAEEAERNLSRAECHYSEARRAAATARLAEYNQVRWARPVQLPSPAKPPTIRERIYAAAAAQPGEFTTADLVAKFDFADSTIFDALTAGVKLGWLTVRDEHVRGTTFRHFWHWLGRPPETHSTQEAHHEA